MTKQFIHRPNTATDKLTLYIRFSLSSRSTQSTDDRTRPLRSQLMGFVFGKFIWYNTDIATTCEGKQIKPWFLAHVVPSVACGYHVSKRHLSWLHFKRHCDHADSVLGCEGWNTRKKLTLTRWNYLEYEILHAVSPRGGPNIPAGRSQLSWASMLIYRFPWSLPPHPRLPLILTFSRTLIMGPILYHFTLISRIFKHPTSSPNITFKIINRTQRDQLRFRITEAYIICMPIEQGSHLNRWPEEMGTGFLPRTGLLACFLSCDTHCASCHYPCPYSCLSYSHHFNFYPAPHTLAMIFFLISHHVHIKACALLPPVHQFTDDVEDDETKRPAKSKQPYNTLHSSVKLDFLIIIILYRWEWTTTAVSQIIYDIQVLLRTTATYQCQKPFFHSRLATLSNHRTSSARTLKFCARASMNAGGSQYHRDNITGLWQPSVHGDVVSDSSISVLPIIAK